MSQPKRIALSLGAGASKPLGFPLTGEILPEILARLGAKSLFGPATAKPRPSEADLRAFLFELMPGLSHHDSSPPLITDVLSLIDQMLAAGNVPGGKISDSQMRHVRLLLERAIFRVLDWPYDHKDDAAVPALLKGLVDGLIESTKDEGAHCTIVSTNYDIAVEREIYRRLGFGRQQSGQGIGNVVDLGFTWREPTSGRVYQRPQSPRFSVHKLHGSMNWLACPVCDHVYFNPLGTIEFQAFREKVDNYNTCHCGYGPLQTVMVAPSFIRNVQDSTLLTVWRSALEDLRTADEWILIGYSMPAEDIAIRSLLIRAYRGRWAGEKPPTVRVIQRGPDAKQRYRLFFPECEYSSDGLEEFVASWPGSAS